VDVAVDPATAGAIFARVQRTWTELGGTEPYWSVLSSEQFRMTDFDRYAESFYASGRGFADLFEAFLRRNGLEIGAFPTCLEFGCGVGRVTRWLAERFARVVATDISLSHLALARKYLAARGLSNVTLHHDAELLGVGAGDPVDAVCSVIVLQHNPPPVIAKVLGLLLGRLRPGGVAFLQVPTYARGYRFDARAYLAAAQDGGGVEMHVLPQAHLFRVVGEAGCELLECREDYWVGVPGWISNSVLVRRKESDR
jgi:SAM-dependent methyltransferase